MLHLRRLHRGNGVEQIDRKVMQPKPSLFKSGVDAVLDTPVCRYVKNLEGLKGQF